MGLNCGESPLTKEIESFTAEDARRQCENVISTTSIIQLKTVLTKIHVDSANGKSEIYYYDSLLPNVVKDLEKRGFQIKYTSDQRDGSFYNIKW